VARIVCFFDFVSPFSYLQFAGYPELFRRPGMELRPVVFAGLLNHWGQKGPAEITEKRKQTYRFVAWQARKLGIALRFPPAHPFNPIHVLRLAVALGATPEVVGTIYELIWKEGRSVADEWTDLCARLKLSVSDAEALSVAPGIKEKLRRNGEEAIAAGVFGVPTVLVDGEKFWGFDATPMLLEYLADPHLFNTAEMRRIEALPIAAERRGQ
jgi:2-hydroxychromene-2-carboxylate isomerase